VPIVESVSSAPHSSPTTDGAAKATRRTLWIYRFACTTLPRRPQSPGKKSIKETEASVNAFILPQLGEIDVAMLSPARLRNWHMAIAAAPPRLRTRPGEKQKVRDTADDPEAQRRRHATANRRPGEKQKVRDTADDPEAQRRRHATANRILTVLKAALKRPCV
jgi:hypothetical protein